MVLGEVTERNPGQQLLQKAYGFHIKKKKNEHRVRSKSSLIVERTRRAGGVAQM